jgi:hypothetical protein
MSEYDDLERQLRRSVRARGAASAAGAAGGTRDARAGAAAGEVGGDAAGGGARRRTRRRWFGLLAVPAVLVAGAAGAAGIVGGPGTEEAASRLVRAAVTDTRRDPACHDPAVRVGAAVEIPDRAPVDDAPLPQIARALPALVPRAEATPPAPGSRQAREAARALATARRVAAGAAVLRGTVRVARFADGGRVLAFVSTHGGAIPGPPDRAGCARLRREHVLRAQRRAGAPTDDPVTARALVLLADQRDTAPGAQTLWLTDLPSRARGGSSFGSTGIAVTPLGDVPTGVAMTSSGRGQGRFVGLVDPRTVRIVVRPAPGSRRAADPRLRRAVTRRARTDQGIFAVTEPWPGAGPLMLAQYDRSGRVVARERLRR